MKAIGMPVGLLVLFALILSAWGSVGAKGADRGYVCEKVSEGAQFKDAHCLTAVVGGEKSGFRHKLIGEATPITVTNLKTVASTTAASVSILKGHIAGVETAIQCTTVHGTGSLTNGVTNVSLTSQLTYSGCTVTLPASKGCKVGGGGVISTNELKGTTEGTTGTRLELQPASGSIITSLPIEGCEKERPPKGTYVIEGSIELPTSGATLVANHTELTTQGTLLFGGTTVGLEGALTVSMKEPNGEPGNAITLTP